MKQGWTYKKLGEVCNIDFGTRVVRSRDAGSIYPVYGGGGATFKMDTYNREDSMVISRFGMSEQCTRFVKGKFFLNDSGLTLSMKEPCMIQSFMDWEVFSLNNIIYSLGRGAAQKNLDTKALAEVILSYPNSLSEQQRIVERLDSAFAHIDELKANAEKQVNEARALFQKALSKAMEPKDGWEEKTLGEVSIFSQGIQVDVNLQTESYSPGKVRFLRIIDVTQGKVPPRYIDDPGDRYHLKMDEIAMVRYGTVGFVCYGYEGVIANNLFKITIKENSTLQSNYLQYFLKSNLFQSHIRNGVGGAALPAIKFGDIKPIKLGIPPLSEQQRIVERLDSLSENVKALEENQRKVMAECDALKQALLRKVFE